MNSASRFIACAIIVMIAGAGFCVDDFGPLEKAKKALPAIFIPDNVLVESCKGTEYYVYNGVAERCFSGPMAESDGELYREAVADAKRNLFEYLTKGDKKKTVELSGATVAYQYSEDKLFHAICLVPKAKVAVRLEQAQKPSCDVSTCTNSTAASRIQKDAMGGKKEMVAQQSVEDKISAYKEKLAASPDDCVTVMRLARLYERKVDFVNADTCYRKIVSTIVANEKFDKELAADFLLEIAEKEESRGDFATALKHYRLILRCDSLRRWGMEDIVQKANAAVSRVALKVR